VERSRLECIDGRLSWAFLFRFSGRRCLGGASFESELAIGDWRSRKEEEAI